MREKYRWLLFEQQSFIDGILRLGDY